MSGIVSLRKIAISLAMFAVVTLGSLATAKGDSYSFSGSPNGKPVTATASITQSGNTLTIVLTNTTANIQDVGQAITDFSFKINGVTVTGSSFTASGQGIFVDAGGNITQVGGSTANDDLTAGGGWTLSSPTTGQFYLNALGSGQPQFGILGPPTAGVYSSANNSIAGNAPHNPFVEGTATFTFVVAGLADGATFSDVFMSFGTTAGANLTSVPEPASLLLLGVGLLGVAGVARRRYRKT